MGVLKFIGPNEGSISGQLQLFQHCVVYFDPGKFPNLTDGIGKKNY